MRSNTPLFPFFGEAPDVSRGQSGQIATDRLAVNGLRDVQQVLSVRAGLRTAPVQNALQPRVAVERVEHPPRQTSHIPED
eukprot:11155113-Lingulodinium_polyedra.AAC.1